MSDQLIAEFHAFVGQDATSKYIFLSKSESIAVENEVEVYRNQLPPDVNLIYLKIEHPNIFVEVKCRTRFRNLTEVADKSLNEIVIHGPNPVAVRGLGVKVENLLKPQRFLIRTAFYRYPLSWLWVTLLLLWFGEYRIANLLVPALSLRSPLSALGAILIFAFSLGTALVYINVVLPFFTCWFPYFEIEGNISTHRSAFQKLVGGLWLSLLATGLINTFHLLRK